MNSEIPPAKCLPSSGIEEVYHRMIHSLQPHTSVFNTKVNKHTNASPLLFRHCLTMFNFQRTWMMTAAPGMYRQTERHTSPFCSFWEVLPPPNFFTVKIEEYNESKILISREIIQNESPPPLNLKWSGAGSCSHLSLLRNKDYV